MVESMVGLLVDWMAVQMVVRMADWMVGRLVAMTVDQ